MALLRLRIIYFPYYRSVCLPSFSTGRHSWNMATDLLHICIRSREHSFVLSFFRGKDSSIILRGNKPKKKSLIGKCFSNSKK